MHPVRVCAQSYMRLPIYQLLNGNAPIVVYQTFPQPFLISGLYSNVSTSNLVVKVPHYANSNVMEDTVSRTSIDSISSGGEFVVVQAEPRLRIPGNGDTVDLEKKLSEVRW